MKLRTIATLAALMLIGYAMTACVETTTTMPDGSVVTQKAPAPGSIEAGVAVAKIIAEK